MLQDFKVILPSLLRNVGWLPINSQIKTNSISWNFKSPLHGPCWLFCFSLLLLPYTGPLFLSLILHNSLNTSHVFPGSILFVFNVPFFWILSLSLRIKILLIILQGSSQIPPLLPNFPFERNILSLWITHYTAVTVCLLSFSFSLDSRLLWAGPAYIWFIFLSLIALSQRLCMQGTRNA